MARKCDLRGQLPGVSHRAAGAGLPVRWLGYGAKLDSMTVNPDEGRGST